MEFKKYINLYILGANLQYIHKSLILCKILVQVRQNWAGETKRQRKITKRNEKNAFASDACVD